MPFQRPKLAGEGLPKPGACWGGSSGFGSQEYGFLPLSVSEEAGAWPETPALDSGTAGYDLQRQYPGCCPSFLTVGVIAM